jgi:iron complex outermembrane receptor protein
MIVALWFLPIFAGSPPGTVLVRVRHGAAPIATAEVAANGAVTETDERGEAILSLPEGGHEITVSRLGFVPVTAAVSVTPGAQTAVTVQLTELRLEEVVIVVSATRSGRIVEDQPIRVETVPQEEIEENATIAPGNLSTLLNELAGVQVQTSAPALGGARLRLQALSGRYTQILFDDLPLAGEQPDDFGLLQTPPLDLARVEVIKGASTALYGGTALGGVINLVSSRPEGDPQFLVNQTSRGGTDVVGFLPRRLSDRGGVTLIGGGHRQDDQDLDGDGWADVPGYWRTTLRPRFFRDDGSGRSLFATLGATIEEREGGTIDGGVAPDGSTFRERLHTERYDAGLVGHVLLDSGRMVSLRSSLTGTWHDRTFGEDVNRDLRSFALLEGTITGTDRGHTWVAGAALQRDAYTSRDLPAFDDSHFVPALFAQDEYAIGARFGVSASARVDVDDEDGTLFSPLVSALVRPGGGFRLRLSAASGYAAPTPFTEDTDVIGLWRVRPLEGVEPERAGTASLDVSWSGNGLELNATVFGSRVDGPLELRAAAADPGSFELANAATPTRTYGSALLARFVHGPTHLIATYTYAHATEDPSDGDRRDVPLTPRHSGEIAAIWESERRGRIGFEVSYTGTQTLEHDPYRATSPDYVEANALAELRVGEARVFVNAINVTDVRQTRYDPLLLPTRADDGRWTTDAWAPLDGRVFNAGVRLEF